MRAVAGPLDLLDHEAPAARPLKRELDLTACELSQPRTHLSPRRRREQTDWVSVLFEGGAKPVLPAKSASPAA
jgi:hypothetical protein